jgi:nucleoside-diphosphate-sugar epimerase
MRVLIGGATGAIGRSLIGFLRQHGHAVFALARSPGSARVVAALGAEAVIVDALDATAMKAAIMHARPEAVINELTSLPRHYTTAEMVAAAERDRHVRIEGNKNFLAVLPDAGVHRYLLQSSGFWYAPGAGLADENEPFAFAASPAVAAGAHRYAELEQTASAATDLEFVALRYGFFYGSGTWFDSAGDMGEQVRRQQVPVIGDGQGVWSWVHIEDAAAATAAALECAPGAYNLVDDDPASQQRWLPAFAHAVGAPPPPRVSEAQALSALGPDAVYYATQLRGAANGKAKRELDFRPRRLEWLSEA